MLEDLLKKTQPMSVLEDMRVVQCLIEVLSPTSVIEFGVGVGGWILTVNHLIAGIRFTGVENFLVNYGFDWPNTKEALERHLIHTAAELGDTIDVTIIDGDAKTTSGFEDSFDLVRIDCLDHMQDVLGVVQHVSSALTAQAVFFVDDIAPYICPGRFTAFMDLSYREVLFPVWFGHKEGVWATSLAQARQLQAILSQRQNGQSGHVHTIEMNGHTFTVFLAY